MKQALIFGLAIVAAAFITACLPPQQACTEEAKICPDGSTVVRNASNNCEFDPCPSGGAALEDFRRYVSRNTTQCAASDWLCPDGTQQFYGETGCGCEPTELRRQVSNDTEQCQTILFMCEGFYTPFFDETGCGCEFNWDSVPEDQLPPMVGQQSPENLATNCTEPRPEVCTQEYDPACGWFNDTVQCIRYPCADTYGNSCQACADSKVAYWTEGACPNE